MVGDVTLWLAAIREGDRHAESQLFEVVFAHLRRIAAHMMRSERIGHTLQPTALVNEAYLQILGGVALDIRDRSHFYALASQAMRRILIDYARANQALKRGGEYRRITLEGVHFGNAGDPVEILDLDAALCRLATHDPRQSRVVELRYFCGLTEDEIADLLGVTSRTVKRDWSMAKAWLYGELTANSHRIPPGHSGT